MTYKLDGVEIYVQPTEGRWLDRSPTTIDGAGHPTYPGVHQFEMVWKTMPPSGVFQLQAAYEIQMTSGSAVVDLPKYKDAAYGFFAYSGTVLHEPSVGRYFSEYYLDVRLLVTNINT